MLSKQQKQRYGQILRQQMKEKEQRKRFQDSQKRGNQRPIQPSREQPVYQPPAMFQKQNTYMRPYVDPKQQLQKKLQGQDYNPFGGSGGGAPNRRMDQNATNLRNMSQPTNVRMGADQMMGYNDKNNYQIQYNMQPQQRMRTLNQEPPYYQGQMQPNQMQSISPQSINYPRQSQQMRYQDGGISSVPPQGRMPNPYQQQPAQNYPGYNNSYNYNRQESRQPVSYELIPDNTKQSNSRLMEYPPSNGNLQQSYQPSTNQIQGLNQQRSVGQGSFTPPPMDQSYQPYDEPMNENTNQELQEVYKKGGRNLLKLQNETIDQQLLKQKRKMEIQKQLKQQIEQGERRKKQQKQRLKRQQEEDERKHLMYLAEQKRKVQEEQRHKREEKQKIIDDNVRNLEQKKHMDEEAKRKVERERLERQRRNNDTQKQKEDQLKQQQENQRKKNQKPQPNYPNEDSRGVGKSSGRITDDDNTSVVSSETSQLEKGFNAALSKQFFRKQRQKNNPSGYKNNKLEQFQTQINQMSNEMAQQRNFMARQIDNIRGEAQKAKIDKRKAEDEIQRLKRELKKKMDDDNQKLLRALQGNDFRNNDYNRLPPQHYKNLNNYEAPMEQYNPQNQYPSFGKKPLRQKQHQHLVQRQFQTEPPKYIPKQEQSSQFEHSNVGMISLDGDSKKIPLFLEHSDKLTMSQVENFAKDSSFFQNGGMNGINRNSPGKQKYNMKINESIAEQPEEDRDYANNQSRKSNRYKQGKKQSSLNKEKDELDRMIQSRAKSRGGWGQMSSVNSDINKQIEELLKQKDAFVSNNNGRPSSISNAGKQSLSKQGFSYDGLTLNSHVGGTLNTNGTVDLERINGRNDARLRQLKNLGVQTINTNGDDDLNSLDRLLNKYN